MNIKNFETMQIKFLTVVRFFGVIKYITSDHCLYSLKVNSNKSVEYISGHILQP